MAETSLEEQTALVALLQERPGNRSWSDLASTVLELGSAVAARRCLVPESLFEDAYATVAHWPCIETHTGSTPDGWACVPSLSGRSGPHPLEEIVSKFMRSVPNVAITPGPVRGNARSFDPNHFAVQTTSARHVLLIDDTWTTGAHLQSAAAALQKVGVEKVTGLVMARWLEPTFGNTQAFIEGLTSDFNPDICPYTGHFC